LRAGISRVAVEVILLVLAVALALLIFSPVGSFIFSALGRTQLVGGTTTIEIIGVTFNSSTGTLNGVVVKNQGPTNLSWSGNAWQVTIKSSQGEETVNGTTSASNLPVGGTITLAVSPGIGGVSRTDTFTVVVYGPEGTRTEYIYRP